MTGGAKEKGNATAGEDPIPHLPAEPALSGPTRIFPALITSTAIFLLKPSRKGIQIRLWLYHQSPIRLGERRCGVWRVVDVSLSNQPHQRPTLGILARHRLVYIMLSDFVL